MTQTAGEYDDETKSILMNGETYNPYELRNRVNKLIDIEKRAKAICKSRSFRKIKTACPYCGWIYKSQSYPTTHII